MRLDLLPNLVSIHMDREIAFLAQFDGRLRVLIRQPPESAGRPNVTFGDAALTFSSAASIF